MSQNFDDLFSSAKGESSNPYASPGPASGPQYGGPYDGGPPPSNLALASMILGIGGAVSSVLGSCCCLLIIPVPLICSLAAIACGFMAQQEINRGEKRGKEMALAGIILGFVGLALVVLGIVMMFFGFAVQGLNQGGRPPRF